VACFIVHQRTSSSDDDDDDGWEVQWVTYNAAGLSSFVCSRVKFSENSNLFHARTWWEPVRIFYPTKTREMGLLYGENFIILTYNVLTNSPVLQMDRRKLYGVAHWVLRSVLSVLCDLWTFCFWRLCHNLAAFLGLVVNWTLCHLQRDPFTWAELLKS